MSQTSSTKGWRDVFEYPLAVSEDTGTGEGLTMVIDKGLGLARTEDLLQVGSGYIDFLKLSFGTSAFYEPAILKRKIDLVKENDVDIYPGGTFFEIAFLQDRVDEFLGKAKELGFTAVEISDGTVSMDKQQRRQNIEKSDHFGLKVLTEVGKKHPADQISKLEIAAAIKADLEAGADKVIIEGRESGKGVVIYNQDGSIDENELEFLAGSLDDLSDLIWEAPLKRQQESLILRFGPQVNLGGAACAVTPCVMPCLHRIPFLKIDGF